MNILIKLLSPDSSLRVLLVTLALLLSFKTQSQDITFGCGNDGAFDVSVTEGCAPLTVKVTNRVADSDNVSYNYTYDGKGADGTVFTNETSYTYNKPGTYVIFQIGSKGSAFSACKVITVLGHTPPELNIEYCEGQHVKLSISNIKELLEEYDELLIDWADMSNHRISKAEYKNETSFSHSYAVAKPYDITVTGIFSDESKNKQCAESRRTTQKVNITPSIAPTAKIEKLTIIDMGVSLSRLQYKTLPDYSSKLHIYSNSNLTVPSEIAFIDSTLNTTSLSLKSEQVYTLKIVTDLCGRLIESNPITTIILTAVPENEQNKLTWNEYPSSNHFKEYQIYRDDALIHTISNSQITEWIDTDITCGELYKYHIIAFNNDHTSISATKEIQGISTTKPSPFINMYTTVSSDNSVQVSGETPLIGYTNTYDILIERSTNNGSFEALYKEQISNNLGSDYLYNDTATSSNQNSYCYQFTYQNSCGVKSNPSEKVCTIHLSLNKDQVEWTSFLPFNEQIGHYELLSNGAILERFTNNELTFDISNLGDPNFLQIFAYSQSGNLLSSSNAVQFDPETKVILPTAFSPNNDNINDFYGPTRPINQPFTFTIYSKWGEVLFHTIDKTENWDGTYNGQPMLAGSYSYRIEVYETDGRKVLKTGTFLLIR